MAKALVAALLEAAKDELEAAVHGLLDEEDHVQMFWHDDLCQHLHFATFGRTSRRELLYLIADGHAKGCEIANGGIGALSYDLPEYLRTIAAHQRDVIDASFAIIVKGMMLTMCGLTIFGVHGLGG